MTCVSSLVIYSTPSFFLLCHPSVEETRSFVPWKSPRSGPRSALTVAFPFAFLTTAARSGLLGLGTAAVCGRITLGWGSCGHCGVSNSIPGLRAPETRRALPPQPSTSLDVVSVPWGGITWLRTRSVTPCLTQCASRTWRWFHKHFLSLCLMSALLRGEAKGGSGHGEALTRPLPVPA